MTESSQEATEALETLAMSPAPPEEPGIQILDLSDVPEASGTDAAESLPPDHFTKHLPESPKPGTRKERREAKDPKTGVPNAKEWQEFIGLTVLRLLTQGYLWLVLFRDVDESDLTSRERDLIQLQKDDLIDMAAPMATVVSKNRFARKHGRGILAMADSYESIIDLFIWMRRVNRIAKKYRAQRPVVETVEGDIINGQVPGQNHPQGYGVFNPGHHG